MSKTTNIVTGPGAFAVITGDQGVISVQNFINGLAVGEPVVLAQGHSFDGGPTAVTVNSDSFSVTELTTGGYELVFNEAESDSGGFTKQVMVGIRVDADGNPSVNLHLQIDNPDGFRLSGAIPTNPQIYEMPGGRFAVAYETFDASNHPVSHVAFGNTTGLFTDTIVASRPDAITPADGDVVVLAWFPTATDPNAPQQVLHEVLGGDGTVLAGQGVVNSYILSTAGFIATPGFGGEHDEIELGGLNNSGPHSTLTFDVRDHSLTWDQDSEGPSAPVLLTTLNVDKVSITNLAMGFRPEVLKNIAADGSSTIQWFDSDHTQAWDTLIATETPAGAVVTYTAILDDGTKTVFNFDADNSQPYTRYVDQDDAAGHVLVRTVLLDDGESWLAKFQYAAGQIVSYEVDSFDAAGHQVGQGFFNADGSILTH